LALLTIFLLRIIVGKQIVGIQTFGVPMVDDTLMAYVLELRMMMHVLWKIHVMTQEQHLSRFEGGFSLLQVGILRMLFHEGQLTSGELSRRFSLDPSTLVPTINTLEEKLLILRGSDPNDRRRIPLELTEEGIRIVKNLPDIQEDDPLVIAMRAIGVEKSRNLLELLCEMVHSLPQAQSAELLHNIKIRLNALGVKEEDLICQQS
jgi:DNA-binding MarR family transcriptional regulator